MPPGVVLELSEGLRITIAGSVVENKDVDGCVDVLADDVTIRNTRIRCDEEGRVKAIDVARGVEGLVVEHSEIDGLGKTEVGIGWSRYTLRYVDVHGVGDGARFGDDVMIENSWIHDMVRLGSLHPDALQTTSTRRAVIRGNVLEPSRPDRHRDGGRDPNNAALMLGSELGPQQVRDVLVEHNRMGGGNYTVNARGDIDARGVVIRDNVFVDDARYGPLLLPRSMEVGEGNVMSGSGERAMVDRVD